MAKKPKTPHKNGDTKTHKSNDDETSNSSTVFKTLFGEQNPASNSLFSDNNPFRRKLQQSPINESKLGFAERDAEYEANLDDSDFSELRQQRKRKTDELKIESFDLDKRKSKKLKRDELSANEDNEISTIDDLGMKDEKKKKKKRKRDEVEAQYEAKRYGVVDEVKEIKVEKSVVLGEKRKKIENPEDTMVPKEGFDDENKLLRTVFVGNLPLKLKKKDLLKEFGKFGEIESVRIRSVPITDSKVPRKGAVIMKQINENRDSVNAYIVFKTEDSAQESLTHNMAVVAGNHIRVDRACPPRKKLKGDDSTLYDNKRTVFVGNLPFDVKDEEIYKLFCSIKNVETSVEAVRVIRDPGSSLGKGIAYVLFKTTDAANLVVKRRNLKLQDRDLRLSHAKVNATNTPSKRKNETDTHSSKKFSTPSSDDKAKSLSYQGLRASKSGAQKKVNTRITTLTAKSKSKVLAKKEQKSGSKKRPAVAARKEKALRAANNNDSNSQVVGTKRKMGNRTPDNGGHKKKARKFK